MGDRTNKDCVPARYMLCIMLFLGLMVTFMLRVNINLAIVSMVNSTSVAADVIDDGNDTCAHHAAATLQPAAAAAAAVGENSTLGGEVDGGEEVYVGEFDWNELQQSVVLGSFFWGYVLFQVPGGRIAEIYGTKRVFGGAIFLNGVLAIMLPLAARIHWSLLLGIRASQGLAQGVLFPALSAAVVRWVPLAERARFVSFAVQGASLGVVVSLPLCGYVIKSWGWEAVFYVSGVLALLWTLAWTFLVYDSPEVHPRISAKERRFIADNLSDQMVDDKAAIPWRHVLTSTQFWVGNINAFGNDWGFHTFTTLAPKYISGSLGFDAQMSSWLTSLPFLCQYLFAMAYGTFADYMLSKTTLVRVRKLSVIVCNWMPAVFLVALSMAGCNVTLSVVLLTLSVTVIGAFTAAFYQNPLDIAPNFAGSLTGIMNGIGSGAGAIATPVAGLVLQRIGSSGWSVIFLITATMYILGSLPYMLLADAKIQPWNDSRQINGKGKSQAMIPLKGVQINEEETEKLQTNN